MTTLFHASFLFQACGTNAGWDRLLIGKKRCWSLGRWGTNSSCWRAFGIGAGCNVLCMYWGARTPKLVLNLHLSAQACLCNAALHAYLHVLTMWCVYSLKGRCRGEGQQRASWDAIHGACQLLSLSHQPAISHASLLWCPVSPTAKKRQRWGPQLLHPKGPSLYQSLTSAPPSSSSPALLHQSISGYFVSRLCRELLLMTTITVVYFLSAAQVLCMRTRLVLPYDIQALSIKYAWSLEMKINFGNVVSLFSPLSRCPLNAQNMPSSAFVCDGDGVT